MSVRELGRYWRTARHLRLKQAAYWVHRRVLRSARQALVPAPIFSSRCLPQDLVILFRQPANNPNFPEWQRELSRQVIERRQFQFLNRNFDAATIIPWSGSGFSRLWDYHLHYFDYINVDLTSPRHEPLLLSALTIVFDWIDHNPCRNGLGWAPYPLSVRIVNWLKFLTRHSARLQELWHAEDARKITTSLAQQVYFLEANLEKEVLTNHLIKNIKALIFAGVMLESRASERWLKHGLRLLEREIQEQILQDGGHFQRSPMYHSQVLEDLLDLEAALTGWQQGLACVRREELDAIAALLRQQIQKMSSWLEAMLHPDDEIPLLNDAAFGTTRTPQELLAWSRSLSTAAAGPNKSVTPKSGANAACLQAEARALAHSGYATIRHPPSRSFLVFDCGPLGPSHQPGHGHCDLLSFELSLHGMRVVVDTGTSTYEAGPVRLQERSTSAHNTLRIDGEDPAELWSSFRVGRRPRVGRVTGATQGQHAWVQGRYRYPSHLGIGHSRAVIRDAGGIWWFVDLIEGSGEHRVEAFIHFHPQIQLHHADSEHAQDGVPSAFRQEAVVDFAPHRYRLLGPEAAAFSLTKGWYAPEFGLRMQSAVACWSWQGRLPAMLAFALSPATCQIPEFHLSAENGSCWTGNAKFSLR